MTNSNKKKTTTTKKATKKHDEITVSMSETKKYNILSAEYVDTETANYQAFEIYLRVLGIVNPKEIEAVRHLIKHADFKSENSNERLFFGNYRQLIQHSGISAKPVNEALKKLEDLGLVEKVQGAIKIKSILASDYSKIKAGKPVKIMTEINPASKQIKLDLEEKSEPVETPKVTEEEKSQKTDNQSEQAKKEGEKLKSSNDSNISPKKNQDGDKKAENKQPSEKPQNKTENKPKPHNSARFNGDLNLKQPQEYQK